MRRLTNQEKKKWGYRFKKSHYKQEVVTEFLKDFSQELKWDGFRYNNNLYKYFYKKLESWSNLNQSINMAEKPKKKQKEVHWLDKKKTFPISKLRPVDLQFYQELVEDILKDHGVSQSEVIERFKAKKAAAEKKQKEAENEKNKKPNKNNFSILLKIFNIVRSTFYYKKQGYPGFIRNNALIALIQKMWVEKNRVYGYEKLFHTINKIVPKTYSIWNVRRHYEYLGLQSVAKLNQNPRPKELKNTKVNVFDYVKGNFHPPKPNIYWFTDVSYIKLNDGTFAYLSIFIDGFNNEIVGWDLSKTNDNELVIKSFQNALNSHKAPKICHSDHGTQYTSKLYQHICKKLKIQISMSRVGVSLDNRPAEYFFNLIKAESINHLKGCRKNLC